MKKIYYVCMLLLASLLFAPSAHATKTYATFGAPANEGSWDAENGIYTWTAGWSNLMPIFTFANGELAQYTSLHLITSDYTDTYRVCFMNGSTTVATIAFYSAGQKDLVFSERNETKGLDLSQITHISFGGASGSGTIGLSNVYLSKPFKLEFNEEGKAYIDLSDLKASGDNLTYDDATGTLVSTGGGGSLSVTFDKAYDFTNVTSWKVTSTGDNVFQHWQMVGALNSDNSQLDMWSGMLERNIEAMQAGRDFSAVTGITLFVGGAGTITLTELCLTSNVIVATDPHVTMLTSEMFQNWSGPGADATVVGKAYPSNLIGKTAGAGATVYGDGGVGYLNYADLTGYDKLSIKGTPGLPMRVLMNRMTDGGALTEIAKAIGEDGLLEVDLTSYDFAHLNAIKVNWGSLDGVISEISLYKATVESECSYRFTGSGVLTTSAVNALADEEATIIDARDVKGNGLQFSAANPNCIFIAKDGVLANANNVAVDGVIEQLVVSDGYPFAVPSGVSSESAEYTRAMSNTYGTICLPFDAKADAGVKFYGIERIDGNELVVTEMTTVPAGTPAIIEKQNEAEEQVVVTGDGNMQKEQTVETDVLFTGSYNAQTILAADYAESIFAISNDHFVKARVQINLPGFRAFFAADAADNVNIRKDDGLASGIEQAGVAAHGRVVNVFTPSGAMSGKLGRGVNFVRMSDGTTLNIFVK